MPIGVYVIFCVKNKKFYVGQSINTDKRWQWHQSQLKLGTHTIADMQTDWDKFGHSQFQFKVVEIVEDKSKLLDLESEWILRLRAADSRYGYNKATFGMSRGVKHSTESKLKMSEAAKERNARPEYNKMISERCKKQHETGNLKGDASHIYGYNKGRPMSEAQKQKLRESALARKEQMREAAQKSVEARRKMVEEDPDTKSKLYGGHKGKKFSIESRQKMSDSAKRRWSRP